MDTEQNNQPLQCSNTFDEQINNFDRELKNIHKKVNQLSAGEKDYVDKRIYETRRYIVTKIKQLDKKNNLIFNILKKNKLVDKEDKNQFDQLAIFPTGSEY